jgi:hypothetical protein
MNSNGLSATLGLLVDTRARQVVVLLLTITYRRSDTNHCTTETNVWLTLLFV